MKYDQKVLYAELTHFYLCIYEKEQVDEPRIRGLVGSLVRRARQAIPEEWDDKAKIHQLLQLFSRFLWIRQMEQLITSLGKFI